MLSRRMMQPGFSSPARTRPSKTCSLKATTRSVSSPPLVTLRVPSRMRLPLAPATLRAGGRISAGMISTVHTPLPIRAAIAPNAWPQRCAPSPESLMISTTCWVSTVAAFLPGVSRAWRGSLATVFSSVISVMGLTRSRWMALASWARLGHADAHEISFPAVDAEASAGAAAAVGDVRRIGVAQAQVRLHAAGGFAARAHRLDDGGGAGHDVATSEHARDGGGEIGVGVDVAALVEPELRRLTHDRIRVRPDREHHQIDVKVVLAPGDRDGAASSRIVGLAQLHANAAHVAHVALAVVEDFDRVGKPVEFDPFLFGVVDLFAARRTLGATTAVDAIDLLRAEPEAHAHRVHRRIAGADDRHALAERERGVVIRELLRAHQVAASQELVGGEHTVQRVAGNAEHRRVACAGADEHRVESHLVDHLLDGEQAPDQRVALEFDAELGEVADFGVDHLVGETDIGDAVLEHAARLVECLVNRDVAAGFGHVGGAGHPGRTGTDDADLEFVALDVGQIGPTFGDGAIAYEPLETADRHRLERLPNRAHAFALAFLWTHPPAHRRQQVGRGDHVVGGAEILLTDLLDEAGDVDAHRAATYAGLIRAEQATLCFDQRVLLRVTAGHLREILHPFRRFLLLHRGSLLGNGPDGPFLRHVILP